MGDEEGGYQVGDKVCLFLVIFSTFSLRLDAMSPPNEAQSSFFDAHSQEKNEIKRCVVELLHQLHYRETASSFPQSMQYKAAYECRKGTTLYGHPMTYDFMLTHPKKWPKGLALILRYQKVSGSVDEKYPFFVASIEKNRYDTILILDGGGYDKNAWAWLCKQARDKGISRFWKPSTRLKHVFRFEEFKKFAREGNL